MPVPEQREAVERHLLRDTAYTVLRDAIVDGTLGPGEVLHDDQLCRWLSVSRTPLRAALARLRDDGLIEMSPQRYTRVAPLDHRDIRETFPLLAVVHGLATELALPHVGSTDVATLERENAAFVRALRAQDHAGAHAADERFHAVFVVVADNREVVRTLDRLTARLHRLQWTLPHALPGRRSVAQHQAVIARVRAGEAAAAASAVRENWMTLGSLFDRALEVERG